MDSISLSSGPYEERVAQVGSDDYEERAHRECRAWARQMRRHASSSGMEKPDGVSLRIASNPHDFGTYYEVHAFYSDEEGMRYALWLEENMPAQWDAQALMEIHGAGQKV